jgi:hypothetical protein
MKTLDQVEARTPVDAAHTPGDATNSFIITQSGSYYLTGNLTGASGLTGISITADNVTVDLNGFSLVGAGNNNTGIDSGNRTNVTLTNGTIRSWQTGISSTGSKVRVEKIRAVANSSKGFALALDSQVSDCVVEGSTTGITTGMSCTIDNCSIAFGGTGINAGTLNTISNCRVRNGSATGIVTNTQCVIQKTLVVNNGGKGIDTATVAGSYHGTTIEHCQVLGNAGISVELGGSCILHDSVIEPASTADGVFMGSTLSGAWIYNNQIRRAVATRAGIRCGGSDTRIDSNTFSNNSNALVMTVGSSGNFITRNVFAFNATNYTNSGGTQKDAQLINFGTNQVSTDPLANIR